MSEQKTLARATGFEKFKKTTRRSRFAIRRGRTTEEYTLFKIASGPRWGSP